MNKKDQHASAAKRMKKVGHLYLATPRFSLWSTIMLLSLVSHKAYVLDLIFTLETRVVKDLYKGAKRKIGIQLHQSLMHQKIIPGSSRFSFTLVGPCKSLLTESLTSIMHSLPGNLYEVNFFHSARFEFVGEAGGGWMHAR